jgi:hypothetical protein
MSYRGKVDLYANYVPEMIEENKKEYLLQQ